MEEVSGPVIAIAIILAAVFIPTAFIPGSPAAVPAVRRDDRRLGILSAFNALSLSPALAALLLKPKKKEPGRCRSSTTGSTVLRPDHGRVRRRLRLAIRKSGMSLLFLVGVVS